MLNIRPVWKADELKRFGELEEKYHYMGETHSGGDTLRLVIEDGGEWVAIMVWGGACYHLLRRDEHIGWTPSLRAQRLKLIASNRRFTILAKPGERRNLASQCLERARAYLLYRAASRHCAIVGPGNIAPSGAGACPGVSGEIPDSPGREHKPLDKQTLPPGLWDSTLRTNGCNPPDFGLKGIYTLDSKRYIPLPPRVYIPLTERGIYL